MDFFIFMHENEIMANKKSRISIHFVDKETV